MPDKFEWVLDQCRNVLSLEYASCFRAQSFMWELRDKSAHATLIAAGLLMAIYLVIRCRHLIKGGIMKIFGSRNIEIR